MRPWIATRGSVATPILSREPPAVVLRGLAAAGVGLCAAAVAVALTGAAGHAAPSAVLHGLMVAVPVSVGLIGLARRRADRFSMLLVAAGLLFALPALAEASAPVPYSLGRVAAWVADLAVVLLILAYPSGRLATRADRRVGAALVVVAVVLYVPTALVVARYPLPEPWSSCTGGCPANAFDVQTWAVADDVIRPAREVLTAVLFALVTWLVARRWVRAGPLLRRSLSPVLLVAAFHVVAYVVYTAMLRGGAVPEALRLIGYVYMATLPLVALGFGVGLLVRRLHVATVLRRLGVRLGAHAGAGEVRAALAEAFEDPTLRVLYLVPGDAPGWVDETGWPVAEPRPDAATEVTRLESDGRLLGVIVHDATHGQDAALLDAAAGYVVVVLENTRLVERLQSSLHELSASRGRIVAVADESRQRIERDLHDGAQQRLIGVRLNLSMQSDRLRSSAPGVSAALADLGEEVEDTIDQIRDLAHGIYPAVLVDRGLPDALRSAGRRAPVRISVDADGVGRYPREVENTVYFACVEALQNVVKHADGAQSVAISLRAGEDLTFEVRDDGPGFDPHVVPAGTGLTNVRDRVTAVGGRIRIESDAGGGTRIVGAVPVDGGGL